MTNARILVVRRDGPDAGGLEQGLQDLGYDVCAVAASPAQAIEMATDADPSAALMDLDPELVPKANTKGANAAVDGSSSDANGLEAARRIARDLNVPVVCLTDGTLETPVPRDTEVYPLTFVLKPYDARQLRLSLDAALALRGWEGRHRETRDRLEHRVEEMQNHIHMMDVIFNSMEEGVIATDQEGNRLAFNDGAVRIGGLREPNNNIDSWAAIHGVFLLDKKTLLPVDENPLVLAMRGQETDGLELFVRNEVQPQGVYVSVTGRPLKDVCNRQRGGVVVFRDISGSKLTDDALKGAFAEGRLEVVDTVLHDIGNAINSVTVGVDTLDRVIRNDRVVRRLSALADAIKAHGDDTCDYLETDPQGQRVLPFFIGLAEELAERNRRMNRTVERVKNRSRHIVDIVRTYQSPHGSGAVPKDITLRTAISNAVAVVKETHAGLGLRFHVDCTAAPKEIRTQESQFHRMLVNVIKNAAEAVQRRQVSDGLGEEPCIGIRAGSTNGSLYLGVTDNGIGFADRESRKFFNAGYTTKESGTGLGLHSAANFVIAMGGRIEISSPGIGKGATVHVELPPPPRGRNGPSRAIRPGEPFARR